MAIQTTTLRNSVATAYGVQATHAMIYSTVPAAAQGTEVAGAAHTPITWSAAGAVGPAGAGAQPATAGVIYGQVTFNVNAGQTVAGAGVHNSSTANTGYLDGGSVTSQAFATSGTYTLNLSYTQS